MTDPVIVDFQDSRPDTGVYSESIPGRDITKLYVQALQLEYNADWILREEGIDLEKYAEILTDDQVYATFQQRRQAVTSREWGVSPGDPEDERSVRAADLLNTHLRRIDWDQTTDKMLYATFYGYAIAEIMWEMVDGFWAFKLMVRNRSRFEFGTGDTLYLRTLENPIGAEVPREKFWVHRVGGDHDDNPHGRGLAHYLYWPAFFKRQTLQFWVTFLDKYATPTLTARGPSAKVQDSAWRRDIIKDLRHVQNDSVAVVADDVVLDLIEATRSGNVEYDTIQQRMNAAIAKVVLSQTMTTDAAGGNYKADVHHEVRDEVLRSDSDQLCASFNEHVAQKWCHYNFGDDVAPPMVWRRTVDQESTNETAERDERLANIGYVPTEQRIRDIYGEGYERRSLAQPMPFSSGLPKEPVTPSEFASALEYAAPMPPLSERRLAHRGAQAAMGVASQRAANQYDTLLGGQVRRINELIDDSDSMEDFAERLPGLIAEEPEPVTVETIRQATMFSRVLGILQQARNRGGEHSQEEGTFADTHSGTVPDTVQTSSKSLASRVRAVFRRKTDLECCE